MKFNLIYVAGYGRSGTTLLDRILGTSEEVFSTGEIVHSFDAATGDYLSVCGCQKPQNECIFWSDILERLSLFIEKNGGKYYFKEVFEKIEGIKGIFYKPTKKEVNLYLDYNALLFESIYEKSQVRYIVDSSKTAWRYFNRPKYLKILFPEMKVIHIQRNVNATAYSNIRNYYGVDYRKSLKKEIIYIKSIISWVFANKMARRYVNDNYLFLKYEDFFLNLEENLKKIEDFLELKSSLDITKINDTSHIFTGNASRFKKITNFKVDEEYKSQINLIERYCSKLLVKLVGMEK